MTIRSPRYAVVAALACLLYGAPAALASDATSRPPASAPQTPHIALLLPMNSKLFGKHAVALRDGFQAAAKTQGQQQLPVREYAVSEEVGNALEGYRTAVAGGAQVVVGPLTRDAVTALAFGEPVPVPTLALNVADSVGRAPGNLYMLSLQVETEARQIAQLAWREGHRTTITVSGGSPVQRRTQTAFAGEFSRLGGKITSDLAFATDPDRLQTIGRAVAEADMAFLALDFGEAPAARAYLGATPAYATASVHIGDPGVLAGYDLAGVSFVDMPWLLEPQHTAVMIYPRPQIHGTIDLERLYALGIDAWRVAQLLLAGARDIRLDGVTGKLTLGPDGQFERELVTARYIDGRPQVTVPSARESAR